MITNLLRFVVSTSLIGVGIVFCMLGYVAYQPYMGYGVDIRKTPIECRNLFEISHSVQYDFNPIVYTDNDNCRDIKTPEAYLADIGHLRVLSRVDKYSSASEVDSLKEEPELWEASLSFSVPSERVNGKFKELETGTHLDRESVNFLLRHPDGTIIPNEKKPVQYMAVPFSDFKFYKKENLPDTFIMDISFDVERDGKKITVKKEIPMEWATRGRIAQILYRGWKLYPLPEPTEHTLSLVNDTSHGNVDK